MPITRKKVRKGLTGHVEISVSAPFGEEEIEEVNRMFETIYNLDKALEEIRLIASKVLASAGLPTDWSHVMVGPDGKWRPHRKGEHPQPKPGWTYTFVTGLVKDRPYTEEWFAAQSLSSIEMIRGHIERGEARNAAFAGLQLGNLVRTAVLKFRWEKHAIVGINVRKGGKKGGEEKADAEKDSIRRKHEAWQKIADEIWKKRPDLSKAAVAKLIEGRSKDGNWNYIRRKIRKN